MKYQIIKHNHEVSLLKKIKLLNIVMKYQIIKHKNHEVSNY